MERDCFLEESESDLSDCDLRESLDAGSCSPLEDGELLHTSSCALDATAHDLDSAIRKAKEAVDLARRQRPSKKRKKHKQKRGQGKFKPTNIRKFVSEMCRRLRERKAFLVEAAVQKLGVDTVRELVTEVETIEKQGGQMTIDGKRRRTPGGVLWNILRLRSEEDYKVIMAKGKEVEKVRKRPVEEDCMDIGGKPQSKRRRIDASVSLPALSAQVKKTGRILRWSKTGQEGFVESKIDPDNVQDYGQVQCAWVEAMKKGKIQSGLNEVEMCEAVVKRNRAPVAQRLRVPVDYEDIIDTA